MISVGHDKNQFELTPPSPMEMNKLVAVRSVATAGSAFQTTDCDHMLGSFLAVRPEEARSTLEVLVARVLAVYTGPSDGFLDLMVP